MRPELIHGSHVMKIRLNFFSPYRMFIFVSIYMFFCKLKKKEKEL